MNSKVTPAALTAKALLEVVPIVMRQIRREMRTQGQGLSVPQFRTLLFVARNPGSSLAAAAEHLGITPATASATVERLVRQGLVQRTTAHTERRRVQLKLTDDGQTLVSSARQGTQAQLARCLDGFADADLKRIDTALELLRSALGEPSGELPAVAARPDTQAVPKSARKPNAK
jgi:DNA-binding MarR family transcriptional regulator